MKILIIEDEPKTAQSIKQALEEHQLEVDVAYDGHYGLRLAEENAYELIITDVILPYMSGIELCRSIRQINKNIPILMLTALGNTDDVVAGFDAGADDYLTKPFEMKELIVRVRALLKRIGNITGFTQVLRVADVELNLQLRTCVRAGQKIDLTPKEFALLEYLIRHRNEIVSKAEIAEKVWDVAFDTGTNVIEVYVNYLRKKIDKNHAQKLIHTQHGLGYVLRIDE